MESLKATGSPGYTDVAGILLDFSPALRTEIGRRIVETVESAAKDNKPHDFSVVDKESACGFTYMVNAASELKNKLPSYCKLKKYQTKQERWLGLGKDITRSGVAHVAAWTFDPWEPSPELDAILDTLGWARPT